MRKLTVSIVIPVYNEEGQLALCLEAIARQTVKPLEVIVVDNNSTDNTAAIARSYPFVTLIGETKQGPAYARDRGFNAARGDVIGRLDGDSIIATDWVEQVGRVFKDEGVSAVSGQMVYRNVALAWLFDAIDRRVRHYLSVKMGSHGEQFLLGSNMAIRRSAWRKVRGELCHERRLHEDIDLACHLAGPNSGVVFRPEMIVSQDWRQAAAGPRPFLRHVWSNFGTPAYHKIKSRRYAWRVAFLVSTLYFPIHVLYKGYNPSTRRFSLAYLLANDAPVRPSPISDII